MLQHFEKTFWEKLENLKKLSDFFASSFDFFSSCISADEEVCLSGDGVQSTWCGEHKWDPSLQEHIMLESVKMLLQLTWMITFETLHYWMTCNIAAKQTSQRVTSEGCHTRARPPTTFSSISSILYCSMQQSRLESGIFGVEVKVEVVACWVTGVILWWACPGERLIALKGFRPQRARLQPARGRARLLCKST